MRHKSICPVCGELKYLHSKEVPTDFVPKELRRGAPAISWICDDCDRPLVVVGFDYTEGKYAG